MSSQSSWTPNYASENASQPLLNICIAFAILETFFVIAFVFSWHFNRDISNNNTICVYTLILAGYIFCFGGVVIGILKITIGGAGHHAETLRPETVRKMLQLIKAHEVIYVLSIPFPKLAILSLYLRLFTAKVSRALLYITGLMVIGTCLFGLLSAFTNCRPLHSFWDRHVLADCSMDVMMAFRFFSVPNIVTDVVMFVMPIPALWRLKVSMLAKIGVVCTFIISTFGIVTAILRFVAFLDVDMFDDITYLSIWTTSWTIIEPGVYLIAATVPTLRPLVRQVLTRINVCPPTVARVATPRSRFSLHPSTRTDTIEERPPLKRKSTKELIDTIGQRPRRTLQLDDYHYVRYGSGVISLRSEDDESMVCADAVIHETMGRQGRNPDGTLRVWSLRPIQFSPMRTSFFADDRPQSRLSSVSRAHSRNAS